MQLQGRTLPNPLHLLVVAEQSQTVDFIKLLEFIGKSKDMVSDMKSLEVIESSNYDSQDWAIHYSRMTYSW